jgi:hypothetical protein
MARLFVVMAREAPVAVILRRGPAKLWRVVRWETGQDQFQRGQWFRGSFYPERCDLSPDGRLFLYFAGKSRVREFDSAYGGTWTAVSYAPYLTALALWPMGDCWGGGGAFLDNQTVVVDTSCFRPGLTHHPLHPPGPLQVLERSALHFRDPRKTAKPAWQQGWIDLPDESAIKRRADRVLRRHPRRRGYTLERATGEELLPIPANWADWDHQGRLAATFGGRLQVLQEDQTWTELLNLDDDQFEPIEAPDWAKRWELQQPLR